MNPTYVKTVNLLLDIAPTVFQTPQFAMKGGTALNLFVQDLPRLSVDIDVAFINHRADRDNAFKNLPKRSDALRHLSPKWATKLALGTYMVAMK